MKTIRVAVAGLGRIGKIHLDNLCRSVDGVEVLAVMDVSNEAPKLAEEYGIPRVFADFEKLLAMDELDAVIICSPTDLHAEHVVKAARAGKHIFCEKPLDLSLDKVKEVLKVVEDCGVELMLGFNRRFDPDFEKIRSLVESNEVGDPQIIKITSRDPGPPPLSYIKSSGGMFLDMAIHDFDMARYISGKEVREVFAAAAVKVDPGIGEAGDFDTAVTTLIFEDDSLAVIDNSREAVYGYDQRLEVFGNKGMAAADNKFPNSHRLLTKGGTSADLPLHFFLERYQESYQKEMKLFIQAIQSGEKMPVGAKDGLMSIVIGLAATLSAKEKRAVKISEII